MRFRTLPAIVEKSITSPDYAVFLVQLRAARKRYGVTQIDLAARLGETQTFVSKCERGERRLDVIELRKFCQALGLPLSGFVSTLEAALDEAGKPQRPRKQKR